MSTTILFVDDEPNVLDGLRRMLRPMRHEWDMDFATSGEQALALLGTKAFDVLVSDVQMPGMDGIELLQEAMKRRPETIRIVLSGHSDQEMILRSVRTAHQFLAKPCRAEDLKSVINRACALRGLLSNELLKGVIARMDRLPSPPALYAEVLEELRSTEGSIRRVGEIISKDAGMAAKILQLVNSAFFGTYRHISSPAQAASLLGLETIKALVLTVQIFSQFDKDSLSRRLAEELWRHGLATGRFAREIAAMECLEKGHVDDSFVAGLLHDVGKLVLGSRFPAEHGRALGLTQDESMPLWQAEQAVFGATHAEVGAYLMGMWGLPDAIVEAIAFHHDPGRSPQTRFGPLMAIHVANALDRGEGAGGTERPPQGLSMACLDRLGLSDRLPRWRERCHEITGRTSPPEFDGAKQTREGINGRG